MRAWCVQAGGPGCGDVHSWALGLSVWVRRTQAGWRACGGAHTCSWARVRARCTQAGGPGCGDVHNWASRFGIGVGRIHTGWRVCRGAHTCLWGTECVPDLPRLLGQAAGVCTPGSLGPGPQASLSVCSGRQAKLRGCAHLGPCALPRCKRIQAGWRVCRGAHSWLWGVERVFGVLRLAGQAAGGCTPEPLGSARVYGYPGRVAGLQGRSPGPGVRVCFQRIQFGGPGCGDAHI